MTTDGGGTNGGSTGTGGGSGGASGGSCGSGTAAFQNTYSLSFDGSTQYLDTSTAPVLAYPFTISAWVKTSSATTQTIAGLFNSTVTNQYFRITIQSTGNARIEASNTTNRNAQSTGVVNDGLWHQIVGVFASATSRTLYVDGVQAGTSTNNITYPAMNHFSVGRNTLSTPGAYFNGMIDEVAVWNAALSATDVTEIYHSGTAMDLTTAASASGLLSWWRMGDLSSDDPTSRIQDAKNTTNLTPSGMSAANKVSSVP